jgi:hypothetical protein
MIDHVWTVPCSSAVVDKYSNNLSIQNVVEQLNIPEGEPAEDTILPVEFKIVSTWVRADPEVPAQGKGRLGLLTPPGELMAFMQEYPIDLKTSKRNRAIVNLRGFPLRGPGRYVIQVELQVGDGGEWTRVAGVPIDIEYVPIEPGDEDGPPALPTESRG